MNRERRAVFRRSLSREFRPPLQQIVWLYSGGKKETASPISASRHRHSLNNVLVLTRTTHARAHTYSHYVESSRVQCNCSAVRCWERKNNPIYTLRGSRGAARRVAQHNTIPRLFAWIPSALRYWIVTRSTAVHVQTSMRNTRGFVVYSHSYFEEIASRQTSDYVRCSTVRYVVFSPAVQYWVQYLSSDRLTSRIAPLFPHTVSCSTQYSTVSCGYLMYP